MLTSNKYYIALYLNDAVYITNDTELDLDYESSNDNDQVDDIVEYIRTAVDAHEYNGSALTHSRSDVYINSNSKDFKSFVNDVIDIYPSIPIYLVNSDAKLLPILVLDLWSCAYDRASIY